MIFFSKSSNKEYSGVEYPGILNVVTPKDIDKMSISKNNITVRRPCIVLIAYDTKVGALDVAIHTKRISSDFQTSGPQVY